MATGDFVIRDIRHLRWDGSNGLDIAEMCNGIEVDDATWSVQSEDAGSALVLLQYQSDLVFGTWTVPSVRPNVLITPDFPGLWAVLDDAAFANSHELWTDMLQESIDGGQVLLPSYSLSVSSGEVALPALTLASPNFTAVVPLRNAMPTTGFQVTWRATAGVDLLPTIQLQAGKSITKTKTAVTIPLRTVGQDSGAGIVMVDTVQLMSS